MAREIGNKLVMQSNREYAESNFTYIARNKIWSMISNRQNKITYSPVEEDPFALADEDMLPKRTSTSGKKSSSGK